MSELDLPDVNVLVAILTPSHIHHQLAQQWFGQTEGFATTPLTEAGFLRVGLNPAVTGTTLAAATVLASLRSLRADERWRFLADDSSLTLAAIDLTGWVGHKQVSDLHLVNLAASHQARLVTLDLRIRSTLTPKDHRSVLVLAS